MGNYIKNISWKNESLIFIDKRINLFNKFILFIFLLLLLLLLFKINPEKQDPPQSNPWGRGR